MHVHVPLCAFICSSQLPKALTVGFPCSAFAGNLYSLGL